MLRSQHSVACRKRYLFSNRSLPCFATVGPLRRRPFAGERGRECAPELLYTERVTAAWNRHRNVYLSCHSHLPPSPSPLLANL